MTKKTRWKDTLPGVQEPSLTMAALYLTNAIYRLNAPRQAVRAAAVDTAYAAAHIRAVRKSWGVPSQLVGDIDTRNYGPDTLLWDALCEVSIVSYHTTCKRPMSSQEVLAQRLRQAEAALRTYWREARA